ncbi:MAG: hypothetical protein JO063_11320 [Pseudonocardiales bacterium]|nr:hypothetical protein [Pseudonocardiales bacterium]MBV9029662.1 hypothetical protein [Pseudonocardiales bacterium]MBW0010685.1 hypothetical protein [Pseudonocardiales bacterium]
MRVTTDRVTIDWGALGEVFGVSFGVAVGVIVLFAFGVSALATPAGQRTGPAGRSLAVLCFLACALVVGYSVYLIAVR